MTVVSARTVADDVWAAVHALSNMQTFRNGQFVDDDGDQEDPVLDPDGRAHPYAVAYFDAGTATGTDRASAGITRTVFSCQVSCVGGDDIRALWAVDKIRATLTGLTLHGGRLVETSNTMRVDDNIQPARTVRDLFYRLQART